MSRVIQTTIKNFPDNESWGGQYVKRDPAKNHWYDGKGPSSVSKWLAQIQNDFAERADWMLPDTK